MQASEGQGSILLPAGNSHGAPASSLHSASPGAGSPLGLKAAAPRTPSHRASQPCGPTRCPPTRRQPGKRRAQPRSSQPARAAPPAHPWLPAPNAQASLPLPTRDGDSKPQVPSILGLVGVPVHDLLVAGAGPPSPGRSIRAIGSGGRHRPAGLLPTALLAGLGLGGLLGRAGGRQCPAARDVPPRRGHRHRLRDDPVTPAHEGCRASLRRPGRRSPAP